MKMQQVVVSPGKSIVYGSGARKYTEGQTFYMERVHLKIFCDVTKQVQIDPVGNSKDSKQQADERPLIDMLAEAVGSKPPTPRRRGRPRRAQAAEV